MGENETLRYIGEVAKKYGLTISNIFHAGDGNMHPIILFNPRKEGDMERARAAGDDILSYCIEAGGSITGEHGVGMDKREFMPQMFSEDTLDVMQAVRDAFDPRHLCNPGKVFPTPRLCGEVPGPYREHPIEKAGRGERF